MALILIICTVCMDGSNTVIYVTGPARIDHVSAKNH